jgi:hypothetical protein
LFIESNSNRKGSCMVLMPVTQTPGFRRVLPIFQEGCCRAIGPRKGYDANDLQEEISKFT